MLLATICTQLILKLQFTKDLWWNLFNLLVEVFNTLLIAGNAVVRSLSSGKDKICDFSSAEANSSRKLYLNIIRLLEAKKRAKNKKTISCNSYITFHKGCSGKIAKLIKLWITALYVASLPWVEFQRSSGHLQGRGRGRMSQSHHNQLLPGMYWPEEREDKQCQSEPVSNLLQWWFKCSAFSIFLETLQSTHTVGIFEQA